MANKRMKKFKSSYMCFFFIVFYLIPCTTLLSAQEMYGNSFRGGNYQPRDKVPFGSFIATDLNFESNLTDLPEIDISGTWKGVAKYGAASATLTCYLSQDGSNVTGTCETPGTYPTICGLWIHDISGIVEGNIFYFNGTTPTKDLDTCEVICLDLFEGALTINGNAMAGNLTEESCLDGEIMNVTVSLNKEEEPEVYFLDKDNASRQVSGAAADGTSKVIIQIRNMPKNTSIANVQITIDNGDGYLENDAIISNRVYSRTYVSPKYFVRDGYLQDTSRGKREVLSLIIKINGQDIEHPKFYLIKPPIVLLHGLWDYATAWEDQGSIRSLKSKLKEDHGYQYIIPYQYSNSDSFDQLKLVIDNAIHLALGMAKVDHIVSKKADVVAHSMGGLLTKLYGHESKIRSIITVGTPHFGSPWADIVCIAVGCELEEYELTVPQKATAWLFEKFDHPARNGAIKDLRVDEGQHCEANRIDVPNYLVSGISDPNKLPIPGFINIVLKILRWSSPLLLPISPSDLHHFLFGPTARSDWVVSESSQEANLTGTDVNVDCHTTEPIDNGIHEKIINFLHRTTDTGFEVQPTQIRGQEASNLQYELSSLGMGTSSGQVEIISPTEEQVFQPGDTVNIEIDISNENSMVIIGTSTGDSALIDHAPYTFQFMIPINSIGRLNIFAAARDDVGFIGTDEVFINVTSTASLIDMKLYPEFDPLDLLLGASVPLTIYGLYDDAVTRNITSAGTGTSYISSNSSVVEISSEGLLTARSQGEAIVTIENSGVKKDINMVVTPKAVSPAEGTIGTELTITGEAFGTKKGKIFIGSAALTIIDWADGLIHCRLTKVIDFGAYDVTIQPNEPRGAVPIIVKNAFTVKAAEIDSIEQGEGSAYDQVTINGKFFGTKKGKVYLEYEEKGQAIRKNCQVVSWEMNPVSNDGKIVFVVPKMLPEVCDVVVDPYSTVEEVEEESGFTVKAPEIHSVNPGSGSVGGQITILGNYFGSKKPKVYLGYVSNGRPAKKSCPVVSWSDDEIIYTVPRIPVGTYDVIVTNSVSSVLLDRGLIIQ
jgi:pimeloyl-ACP methyl ester carboxylesterase